MIDPASKPLTVNDPGATGPVSKTMGWSAIVAASIALGKMYYSGTIDVQSASAAIGVIITGINSLFARTS